MSNFHITNGRVSTPVLEVDLNDDFSWLAGGQAGLMVRPLAFNSWLGLHTGILFTQKGAGIRTIDATSLEEGTTNSRLQFLTIPLLLRANPAGDFFIEAGLDIGYLLEATSHFEGESFDLNPFFGNKGDFAPSLGIGYQLHPRLGLFLRYAHDLSNLREENIVFTDQNGEPISGASRKWQTRSLQAGLVADLVQWE